MKRSYSAINSGSPPPPDETLDGQREVVVPPLQSLAALTSPAVVNQPPQTPAPPIVDLIAEIMFLVKISPLPPSSSSSSSRQIIVEALDSSKARWRQEVNLTGSSDFEFAVIVEDVVLAAMTADNPNDAERKTFQRIVKRILNSDYCRVADGILSLYSAAEDAPTGSFRYDLRCRKKLLPKTRVPVCESCSGRGHLKRFCILPAREAEINKAAEAKMEIDRSSPPPPPPLPPPSTTSDSGNSNTSSQRRETIRYEAHAPGVLAID